MKNIARPIRALLPAATLILSATANPVLAEQGANLVLGAAEREVANVDLLQTDTSLDCENRVSLQPLGQDHLFPQDKDRPEWPVTTANICQAPQERKDAGKSAG